MPKSFPAILIYRRASSKEGKGTVKIYYNIGEEADFTIGIALCMVYFYI